MHIVLFEDKKWSNFLPLVYTRPVGDLRIGMHKISAKYEKWFDALVSHESRIHLHGLFPPQAAPDHLRINARLLPDADVAKAIRELDHQYALTWKGTVLAQYVSSGEKPSKEIEYTGTPFLLEKITDLFTLNGNAHRLDYDISVKEKKSAELHPSNILIGDQQLLFIAEGAKVYASTLNTNDGPIYIDSDTEVMEGSHIRGPFYLGEHSQVKMASKIYGPTTIGPHCKVGGEISNSVIQGYSNKGHDGFIGNTLVGEWCNLGADTNTSNLKNNYSQVRIWSYAANEFTDTGLTFCGLIMGDHSKCGINTMFNTGTVAGVCSNIFGGDFPPKHIPSFSWGGSDGFDEYDFTKALETADRVMARRNIPLGEGMVKILREVYNTTMAHRHNVSPE